MQIQKEKAIKYLNNTKNKKQVLFYNAVIDSIDTVLNFAEKYKLEAIRVGNKEVADSFSNVPKNPAKNLKEALQSLRFVHAMFYIWLADKKHKKHNPVVQATADGRLNGEPFSSSLSPSHNVKVNGVLSVLKLYSNIDYSRIMNGGPITIELTPSVFSSENGLDKLASLINYFVKLGNQQLQLNVLDLATLEDALIHPELHRNLIVRVWGWSGYFCELAPEYQQHIINRHKYTL